MSEEDVDRELAAAGAEAVALAEEGRGEHEAAVRPVPSKATARPRVRRWWGGSGALAASLAVLLGLAWHSGAFEFLGPTVSHGRGAIDEAKELRALAAADCDGQKWPACLAKLDSAKTLDPAGDRDPQVRRWRDAAAAAVASADA